MSVPLLAAETPAGSSPVVYLPESSPTATKPPLVIFVHSRFWREAHQAQRIQQSFVPALVDAGVAVAIVQHPWAPQAAHPTPIESVARDVGSLLEAARAGRFDLERVFLAGHSSGAQLALLLALDSRWLGALGYSTGELAGVISISGILDLGPDPGRSVEEEKFYAAAFPDAETRAAASPLALGGSGSPAILALTAARDVPGYSAASRRFAQSLRDRGAAAAESFIAGGRDHYSILALTDSGNDARRHILEFVRSDPRAGRLPESWQVLATWREPPFSTEVFYERHAARVRSYAADARFNASANRPFMKGPRDRLRFTADRYDAIDLVAFLEAEGLLAARSADGDDAADATAEAESGLTEQWLEMTNVRGELARFPMSRVRQMRPRLVVGIDGARNLFEVTDLYHTQRRYSWVDPEPSRVDMARPLGAFLYFPDGEPEAKWGSGLFGRYGLTADSFRIRARDPLLALSDLPPEMAGLLVSSHACIACHRFRDVGGRAMHIRARDGLRVGGRALPLERYPAVVWKRFLFDQVAVAREVGADVVVFEAEEAQQLYELVVGERERRGITPWIHPEERVR